jgi:hypothetical protein
VVWWFLLNGIFSYVEDLVRFLCAVVSITVLYVHIKRDMLIQSSVWVIDLHFIQDQNLESMLDSIFLSNHVFVFDCLDADTKPAQEVNGLKCIYMLEQSMQM